MLHKYKITGMTCTSCEENVENTLKTINGITSIKVSKQDQIATITMHHHVEIAELQRKLEPKYQITSINCSEIKYNKVTLKKQFNWNDFFVWKKAGFNTLNCLVGCSIGDFAMIIFLQHFHPETSMLIQMILATITGLITSIVLETSILRFREKLVWKNAFSIAIGMSLISMIAMELAMNITDFMITGGKLTLSSPNYWLAFIPSAFVGFLVPLPYNYYQLKKHNRSCH